MEIEQLRLELLKLTYTHGRDASEAVNRAKELERYVQEEKPKRGRPPKNKPGEPGWAQ